MTEPTREPPHPPDGHAATAHDDYDTPWKDALTRYFPEFVAFHVPDAARQIDWERGHAYLDQELAQVVRDAELGPRRIDKLAQVPMALQQRLWQDFRRLERKLDMPYMTSIERIGLEKGMEKGLQQGFKQGLKRGEAAVLERLLVRRFGPLTAEARLRLDNATLGQLERWTDNILDAQRAEDVFDER